MREIVLDTETTGFDPEQGDRIVEIGAVELFNHLPTGRTYHQYINPERDMPQGAFEVHGLSAEFLSDKPVFAAIGRDFAEFVGDAKLVIHNAAFDMGFLEAEFARCEGVGKLGDRVRVLDSLELARQRYPGQRNSLDALCKRLGVDNSHRQLHGALLDAQLLAEAWLALTAGQGEIGFGAVDAADAPRAARAASATVARGPRPSVMVPAEDLALHEARVEAIRKKAGRCVWDVDVVVAGQVAG